MSHLRAQVIAACRHFEICAFAVSIGLALAIPAYGQISPEEHAKHHPGQAGGATPGTGAMPAAGATPAGGGSPAPTATTESTGRMGSGMDMGMMMKEMGKAPPKELYPTLMSFPNLTSQQREAVLVQATERMHSGVILLSEGLDRLGEAAENDDYAAMHDATARMREALAGFESGVAARHALAEGQPLRQVALQWFRGEMSLQPPQGVKARGGLFGVTPFHLFTMVLLIAFALAMVVMYLFKMRRAAALFGRIETDLGTPPPGSAPLLAGTTPPPAADTQATSA